jgi:hypothetical protein
MTEVAPHLHLGMLADVYRRGGDLAVISMDKQTTGHFL